MSRLTITVTDGRTSCASPDAATACMPWAELPGPVGKLVLLLDMGDWERASIVAPELGLSIALSPSLGARPTYLVPEGVTA